MGDLAGAPFPMRLTRSALSLTVAASLALAGVAGGWTDADAAGSVTPGVRPLQVRIGQTKGLTHIDFPGEAPAAWRIEGREVVLKFRNASPSPELARLQHDPVRLLSKVEARRSSRGLELHLFLVDGVQAKLEAADGVPAVKLLEGSSADKAVKADAAPHANQTPRPRPDPTPSDGRVSVSAQTRGDTLLLRFPWRAPLGAAVFRRGGALWILFDARAVLNLAGLPPRTQLYDGFSVIETADYTALRLTAPPSTQAAAWAEGGLWTVELGKGPRTPSDDVKIDRTEENGVDGLKIVMAGGTGVFWVQDPGVGDRLAVVPALAPAKGLPIGRQLVDAQMLPSVQGLALAPLVDDLQVAADTDVVRLTRPRGLELSGDVRRAPAASALAVDLPKPSAMPSFIDFDGWPKTNGASFMARYEQLQTLAAEEAAKTKSPSVAQRLAFARFLLGSELSYEALGVLGVAAKASPAVTADPQFRGLRGAARAMSGRYKEAQADFSAPVLVADPASSVWRGYVAEKLGDHAGARQQFLLGQSVLKSYTPKWRARFLALNAAAAVGVGDMNGARADMQAAASLPADPNDALALKMVAGRVAEAKGQVEDAMRLYDEVGASPYGGLAAPAVLRATELRIRMGKLAPKDAEPVLNSLRYRWRGDATELETVRSLGKLYVAEGRYREALQALRSANGRLPDLPASIGVSQDLGDIFKALFLNGQADGLQPIQALALFFDFKDLTPIGSDGDEMVRKLARRLVDVDLLDQAAELLKYQVDNRLDGVPKAQVATDLAMIQLMNRRPEDALAAINTTRSTLLPNALNLQRRLIEARAHLALGQYDAALELLEGDKSLDAEDVRAEIAWMHHDWPVAGAKLEAALGDRWKSPGPLAGRDQALLVRAGTAYSLAGDDKALLRLRQRFGRLAETGSAPNAIKVALEGLDGGALSPGDFARLSSQAATFETWITVMKRRFAAEPTPISGPPAADAADKAPAQGRRRA